MRSQGPATSKSVSEGSSWSPPLFGKPTCSLAYSHIFLLLTGSLFMSLPSLCLSFHFLFSWGYKSTYKSWLYDLISTRFLLWRLPRRLHWRIKALMQFRGRHNSVHNKLGLGSLARPLTTHCILTLWNLGPPGLLGHGEWRMKGIPGGALWASLNVACF